MARRHRAISVLRGSEARKSFGGVHALLTEGLRSLVDFPAAGSLPTSATPNFRVVLGDQEILQI